jgi:hypothetical protein
MPGASHRQLAADLMPSSSPQTLSPAAVLPGASQLAADDSPPSSSQPAAVLPGASQLAADNSPPSYSQLLSPAAAHSPGTRQAPLGDSTHAVNPSATAELDRLKTRASNGTLSDHDTQLDTSEVKPGSELGCSFPVTDFGLPRSSLTSRRPWRLRPSCPSSWLGRRCSELAAASAPDPRRFCAGSLVPSSSTFMLADALVARASLVPSLPSAPTLFSLAAGARAFFILARGRCSSALRSSLAAGARAFFVLALGRCSSALGSRPRPVLKRSSFFARGRCSSALRSCSWPALTHGRCSSALRSSLAAGARALFVF